MTTPPIENARVLLVGKRARVLSELGTELRQAGMQVREETDVDRVVSSVDGQTVDVLALGRALTGAKRARVVDALRTANPALKVVDGLAPITAILVAQVYEALTAPAREGRILADAMFESASNRVVLMMRRPAQVAVTMHRLDPLYRAHRVSVFDGPVDRGRQHLPLTKRVGKGERFLVVDTDGEVSVHAVA